MLAARQSPNLSNSQDDLYISKVFSGQTNAPIDVSWHLKANNDNFEINDLLRVTSLMEMNWMKKLEILIFIFLHKYVYNTHIWIVRRNEKHPESWLNANATYHFLKVCELINIIALNIKHKLAKWWKITDKQREFLNIFENYKFVLMVVALFHDVVEDKRWTLKKPGTNRFSFYDPKNAFIKADGKYSINEDYFDQFIKNLKQNWNQDITSMDLYKIHENQKKRFPLFKKIDEWEINIEKILKEQPLWISFEMWLLNVLDLLTNIEFLSNENGIVKYPKNSFWRPRFCFTQKEIIEIMDALWFITFWHTDKTHEGYIKRMIDHDFTWLLKPFDLLHNSYRWVTESQKQKYINNYQDIFAILREVYEFIPQDVLNNLDPQLHYHMKPLHLRTATDIQENLST